MDIEQVLCDRSDWNKNFEMLYPRHISSGSAYHQMLPEFEPLFKTLGPAPVVDHIGLALIERWGNELGEARELMRRMRDIGKARQWGPLYPSYHHGSYAFTANLYYIAAGGRQYSMALALTRYTETCAMVASQAGLSDDAAMLVTEPMLTVHYVPEAARLGVITNQQRGWGMPYIFDPALIKYLDEARSLFEYIMEAQRFVDTIAEMAAERMPKRGREKISTYALCRQVFYAVSRKYAQVVVGNAGQVAPELRAELSKPCYRGAVRMLSSITDKLILCALGSSELTEVATHVDHASLTIHAAPV